MAVDTLFDSSKVPILDLYGTLVVETRIVGKVNPFPIGDGAVPFERINMYRADDRQFRVFARDEDNDPVDVTGGTGVLTFKLTKADSTATFTRSTAVVGEGQLGAATDGEMFFFIVPANTSALAIAQYVFDVAVTLADGKTYTIVEGQMNLIQGVA